jgi:hypothetical protein
MFLVLSIGRLGGTHKHYSGKMGTHGHKAGLFILPGPSRGVRVNKIDWDGMGHGNDRAR